MGHRWDSEEVPNGQDKDYRGALSALPFGMVNTGKSPILHKRNCFTEEGTPEENILIVTIKRHVVSYARKRGRVMPETRTAKLGKEPMVITYEAKVTNAGLLTNVAEVTSDNYDGDPVTAKATVEAKDQPKTGDDSHLLLWMLLATAGLTGVTLIWLAVLRRKQKN